MAQRLVVVGNQMASTQTVEQLREGGGGDQLAMTMLAEEP